MTVIDQMISQFIRTQQSSNVLCCARLFQSSGHWESAPTSCFWQAFENAAWICPPYAVWKRERREENILHVPSHCSVRCYTFNSQKNRIKNYGIFFLCKLPPLIKYATDKVKKEFFSCTNDQVFVFKLFLGDFGKKRFRRTAETSVKINGDRDNEKFNIETTGIYIDSADQALFQRWILAIPSPSTFRKDETELLRTWLGCVGSGWQTTLFRSQMHGEIANRIFSYEKWSGLLFGWHFVADSSAKNVCRIREYSPQFKAKLVKWKQIIRTKSHAGKHFVLCYITIRFLLFPFTPSPLRAGSVTLANYLLNSIKTRYLSDKFNNLWSGPATMDNFRNTRCNRKRH